MLEAKAKQKQKNVLYAKPAKIWGCEMKPVPKPPKRKINGWAITKAFIGDRRRCQIPGCKTPWLFVKLHHLVFKSQGGDDMLENLMILCSIHHGKVHRGELDLTPYLSEEQKRYIHRKRQEQKVIARPIVGGENK